MSEALESWKKKQIEYRDQILKAGHHGAQAQFHLREQKDATAELEAILYKVNKLEAQFTKEDLAWVQNQNNQKVIKEAVSEPKETGSTNDGPLGSPEE